MDISESDIIQRFESQNISSSEWTHANHVRVAHGYSVKLDHMQTVSKMITGIQKLNHANGVIQTSTSGYHHTWTVFFSLYIWKRTKMGVTLGVLLDELNDFRAILSLYYSKEVQEDLRTRVIWVAPDLFGPYVLGHYTID